MRGTFCKRFLTGAGSGFEPVPTNYKIVSNDLIDDNVEGLFRCQLSSLRHCSASPRKQPIKQRS